MIAQYDDNNQLRPVSFCSKTFNQTQQNWHVSEQEIYAVVHMVEKWRYLLIHRKFTVYTDHYNLQELFNKAKNFRAGKLYRWAVRLQDFDFEAKYIKGSDNVFADYLSRDALPTENTTDQMDTRDILTIYTTYLQSQILRSPIPMIELLPMDATDPVQPLGRDPNFNTAEDISSESVSEDNDISMPEPDRTPTPPTSPPPALQQIQQTNDDPSPPNINRRFSKRLRQKVPPEQDKDILKAKLMQTPTVKLVKPDKERFQQYLRVLNEVKELNKHILSYKPDIPTWNPTTLIPTTTPILDHYNEDVLTPPLIQSKQIEDPFLFPIITYLQTQNVNLIKDLPDYIQRYVITGRFSIDAKQLLYFSHNDHNLIVVPNTLRKSIIYNAHAPMLHPGKNRVLYIIQKQYWWPKMAKEIKLYVKTCEACQKVKITTKYGKYTGKLKLFPATKPFEQISIDIVGPLPITTDEYRYFVSIIDKFSRYCMLIKTKNIKALTVLKALEQWNTIFGPPKSILSDNGPQFISEIYQHYNTTHKTKIKYTTTYHPECNGQVERLHRWIKERLALLAYDGGLNFVNGDDDWTDYLNIIQYTYNTTPNRMTSFAPSTIILGYSPCNPIDVEFTGNEPQKYIDYMTNRLIIVRDTANIKQTIYDKLRKRTYDKKKKAVDLEVGDYVLYDVSSRYTGNTKKLLPNYVGPFEIIQMKNEGNTLTLRDVFNKDNVFTAPIKHIKPYNTTNKSAYTMILNHITDKLQKTELKLSTKYKQLLQPLPITDEPNNNDKQLIQQIHALNQQKQQMQQQFDILINFKNPCN